MTIALLFCACAEEEPGDASRSTTPRAGGHAGAVDNDLRAELENLLSPTRACRRGSPPGGFGVESLETALPVLLGIDAPVPGCVGQETPS